MKYLIVGLGNVGGDYDGTRHNIGFDVVDYLAREAGVSFELDSQAYVARMKFKGRQLILIKPTTYMNLSGKAVRYWMTKENISLDHVLVLLDDLNLPLGKLRMRAKGSDGGHNGLKNIQEMLGRTDYPRLRIGIGNEFSKGRQVNYVLGEWTDEERKFIPELMNQSADAVKQFCSIGLARAMNTVNSISPD
ncbi:MAG: aminoacyl-tRNA hydrolase [Saprospiraceae bacterium]|nr:aminoacyl-tRNA hydrolase [Saprospiraceae bacterium]